MAKHTAHIESEWRKPAKRFHNHLFNCPYCRAQINAYCEEGGRLRDEYRKAVKLEEEDGHV